MSTDDGSGRPPRAGGRVPGGTVVWPRDAVRGDRKWPHAREWDAVSPAQEAALVWLQDLAKTVREERFARRIRDEFADRAGLSYNAIKDIETDLRWPSVQTVFMVCGALDLVVGLDHIRHLTSPPPPGPSSPGGSA